MTSISRFRFFLVAGALSMIATPVVDAKTKYYPQVPEGIAEDATDEGYASLKKKATEYKNRKIASTPDLSDSGMSPQLKSYRDRILGLDTGAEFKKYAALRTAAQGKATVTKENRRYGTWTDAGIRAQALDDILAELDDDAKFADEALVPSDLKVMSYGIPIFRAMKSVVYRTRKWVSKTPAVHSGLLGMVRQMITGIAIYSPTTGNSALGAYVTEPMDGMAPVFGTADDFAKFLSTDLERAHRRALRRLKLVKWDKPLIMDNQMAFSSESFQDGLSRYRTVGMPERSLMFAGVFTNLSALNTLAAYDYSDVLDIAKKTGMLYGIDAAAGGLRAIFGGNDNGVDVDGAPMRDRVKILRAHPDFMTLKGTPGSPERKTAGDFMKWAWAFNKRAAEHSIAAWHALKDKPADEAATINPAWIGGMSFWISKGESNVVAMMKGETALKSGITGEAVTVNLPFFYEHPPEDLKAFLPTFSKTEEKRNYEKTVRIGDKDKEFDDLRNYREGAAVDWNYQAYAAYFRKGDGSAPSSSADVKRIARILSQAGGGIAGFMF